MKQLRGFSGQNQQKSEKNSVPNEILDEARKKYGGMDENELIAQLLNNVKTQKQNGTYNEAQLLNFVNGISSQLTPQQRARLESVITVLSSDDNV